MRITPTTTLLLACLLTPAEHYNTHIGFVSALLCQFTHDNIFHLAANLAFIACFLPRWATIAEGVAVGTAAVILSRQEATCGLSAICLAMAARHTTAWRKPPWEMLIAGAALAIITLLTPATINIKAHLYAYIISAALWRIYYQGR